MPTKHGAPTATNSDLAFAHGAAITDPASPGAAYVQAEMVALRTAILAVLAALREEGTIAS